MKRVSFVLLCLAASLPAADVGGSDVIQELQKYYFSVPQNSPARYFANSAANFAPHDIFRVRYGIEADGRSVAQAQHSLLLLRDKIRRGMAWQTPVLKVVLPRVADSVTVNPEDADSLLKSLLAMKGDFLTGKDVLAPVHAETRWYAGYSEKYLFFSLPSHTSLKLSFLSSCLSLR